MDLFSNQQTNSLVNIPLKDASVSLFKNFYDTQKAMLLFETLMAETNWIQDEITLFGKTHLQPRLTALYGSNNKTYSYSNIVMQPQLFTPTLLQIKQNIEDICGILFNTVLLNLYRDGNDSNGWHSDNEKELGKHPYIASLSLGATRMFHLKHKYDPNHNYKLPLTNGSLLVMKDATQEYWKHQIPKTKKLVTPRINLTFRQLV